MRPLAVIVVALLSALAPGLPASAAAAEPEWRLEQPSPPPGAPLKVPLGTPADLEFLAPNRGLLAVEGNTTIPRGLFTWDGVEWHQLSTVCGSPGDSARIAFAGPREFWTVSEPSRPRFGAATALCRFRDGEVVASYSTPLESSDPFREMTAAACRSPDDCWFGGVGSQDPTGERVGAFHLHWNGATLETVYAPQGRGVSDLEAHGDTIFESVHVGPSVRDLGTPVLAEPEPDPLGGDPLATRPRLIHRIGGGRIVNDPFVVTSPYVDPESGFEFEQPDGADLLSLDSDGEDLWAVGGGAASGPGAAALGGFVPRAPLAARLDADGWSEIALADPGFLPGDRLIDVAAVPGAGDAWAAVASVHGTGGPSAKARVVRVSPDGGAELQTLPEAGVGRGSAARIAFTAPSEGWLVTHTGWLFHYTDGTPLPRDTDPAYRGTITFRPNEAAEQFVPDKPPVDDSELFRPPPVEVEQEPPPASVKQLPALLRRIKTRLRGRVLIVRFTLVRAARVALIARRRGRVVARTRARALKPGRRSLRLRLSRRRWPQRLSFSAREPGAPPAGEEGTGGDTGDTITTGVPRPPARR